MPLTDKTISDLRLSLESMRGYCDQVIKSIASGKTPDSAEVQSTIALCKGQVEAIAIKMDADDPVLAASIKIAAAAANIPLASDAKV